MSVHETDDLATASELGRELGVSSHTVLMWRSRHGDFPPPVIDRPRVTMWSRKAVWAWWHAREARRHGKVAGS